MGIGLTRGGTKISLKNGVLLFALLLIGGTATAVSISSNSEKKRERVGNHLLPVKETFTFSSPPPQVLIPMPVGKIDIASSKVLSTRNPFQEPSILEAGNQKALNSEILFTGIAKSGDTMVAMIKTKQGQKAYKVGDSLGNGFTITSISSDDLTVDISDGSRSYRISLEVLNK